MKQIQAKIWYSLNYHVSMTVKSRSDDVDSQVGYLIFKRKIKNLLKFEPFDLGQTVTNMVSGDAREIFSRRPNTNNLFMQRKLIYFKILYTKFKG